MKNPVSVNAVLVAGGQLLKWGFYLHVFMSKMFTDLYF